MCLGTHFPSLFGFRKGTTAKKSMLRSIRLRISCAVQNISCTIRPVDRHVVQDTEGGITDRRMKRHAKYSITGTKRSRRRSREKFQEGEI
jgi:hypothetical protein